MKEIDAVNICLTMGIGVDEVSSIGEGSEETARVTAILRRTRLNFLASGWPFNTWDRELVRDNSNEVKLPKSWLVVYFPVGSNLWRKDDKVFDKVRLTTVLESDPGIVPVVHDVDFDELPHTAANAIAYQAAVDFSASMLGVTDQLMFVRDQAHKYRRQLRLEFPAQLTYSRSGPTAAGVKPPGRTSHYYPCPCSY